MSRRAIQLVAAVAAVLFLAGFAAWWRMPRVAQPPLEEFAQCLTEKGAVMFGAYWCPHCQDQKEMFGDAIKFVRYVECTEEPQTCTNAGIQGFPTWIFRDGTKLVGTQPPEELARVSGCRLYGE